MTARFRTIATFFTEIVGKAMTPPAIGCEGRTGDPDDLHHRIFCCLPF